jgi:Tol biopolymer transport system component
MSIADGRATDVWIYDIGSKTLNKLTSGGTNLSPEWTADGKRVLFYFEGGGEPAYYWQPSDGSGPARRVLDGNQGLRYVWAAESLSPDGNTLLYSTIAGARMQLWTAPLSGDRAPSPLKATPLRGSAGMNGGGRWSPDGRHIAYVSDESGQQEVYVGEFPDSGARVQVSTTGGNEPAWSPDGRQLYYRTGRRLMVAHVTAERGFSVLSRETLFDRRYSVDNPWVSNYDVGRGSAPFLMLKPDNPDLQVIVVANWIEELKARVAQKR